MSPFTTESRLWSDKFNQHFQVWLRTDRTDDQPLLEAAASLRNWLERAPDQAAHIQSVALGATFNARLAAAPDTVATLARVGHDADVLAEAAEPGRAGARVLIELYLAEVELQRRRQYDGLAAVERAERLMRDQGPAQRLAPYLTAFHAHVRAQLWELGLAFEKAAAAYGEAASVLTGLVLHDEKLADLSAALLELLFGPVAQCEQLAQVQDLAARQIRIVASRNAFGHIRALSALESTADLERQAVDAWKVIRRAGRPEEQAPLDVYPLVTALPVDDADHAAALLIKSVAPPDDATWQAVLCAALLAKRVDAPRSMRRNWERQLCDAVDRVTDPLVLAFVKSRALGPAPKRDAIRAFLDALARVSDAATTPLDDLRARALFDDALSLCVDAAVETCRLDRGQPARVHLAVLLDLLRGANWAELKMLGRRRSGADLAAVAHKNALDRLQRIWCGLGDHPDAAAIIFQKTGRTFVFVCLSRAAEREIAVVPADAAFDAAARALALTVAKTLDDATATGHLPAGDSVTEHGRAAFAALPPEVRALIAAHRTLFVVPDFRSKSDDIPLELLHDGTTYLGCSHVIARATSLRSLTRTVERLSRRVPHRRALVVAASHVDPPWPDLPLACAEVARVRTILQANDWDVPEIDEARLTGSFFVQRLELVSWLHVSAHGDVAVDEAIVLPAGEQFTTDDLVRRRYPRLPGAYVNTCSLGQARYVGAGVSRGIAHTLVEAGGPVAIANLLPIEEGVGRDLAVGFYEHARRVPVGEALRLSRNDAAARGAPPILWGTTVLIGDPWDTLNPAERPASAADRLLDAYFRPSGDDTTRADALRDIAGAPVTTDDVRLRAAVAAVQLTAAIKRARTPSERRRLDALIELVDQIDHAPAMAFLRFARLTLTKAQDLAERLRQIDDTLHHLDPLARADDSWSGLLNETRTIAGRERPSAPKLVRRH